MVAETGRWCLFDMFGIPIDFFNRTKEIKARLYAIIKHNDLYAETL